jgi:hypothetical protein
MYRNLDPARIVTTVERLRERIVERFPESSLGGLAGEFARVAARTGPETEWLARPILWLRVSNAALILLFGGILLAVLLNARVSLRTEGVTVTDFLQAVDAGLNTLILVGGGILFLFTVEVRLKRRRALKGLQELRSLAHIVDMHQLTKDPDHLVSSLPATASSPQRTMTGAELIRYLRYCGELLSLIGKVGAAYVQHYDDPVVLSAVDQLEDLTTSLSQKMWQKISVIDRADG